MPYNDIVHINLNWQGYGTVINDDETENTWSQEEKK